MSRYQDWIDSEAAAAEYDEWQDRMARETGGLTGDECEEISQRGKNETTNNRTSTADAGMVCDPPES